MLLLFLLLPTSRINMRAFGLYILFFIVQAALSIPVNNNESHLDFSRQNNREHFELDEADISELQRLLGSGNPVHHQASSKQHHQASSSTRKRPHSSIMRTKDYLYVLTQHEDLPKSPESRESTGVTQMPRNKEKAAGPSDLAPPIVHIPDDNLSERYHLFKKYPWQASYSQKEIEEMYKSVGALWRPMARSTLVNAMDRLGQKLEEYRGCIIPIINHNDAIIASTARLSAPKMAHYVHDNPGSLFTVESFLATGITDKAKRLDTLADTTLRAQISARPKWAPEGMDFATQKAFVTELSRIWHTTEVNVRSRLYRQSPQQIRFLVTLALPGYRLEIPAGDSAVSSEHSSRDVSKRRKVGHHEA